MNDYYKTLGVPRGASKDEIKKSYRKLAHKYHPDRGGDESKFKEVNEAYQTLSDDAKRQQYDQFGRTFNNRASGFSSQGFNPFSSASGQGMNFEFDMGDIFEQFFGGSSSKRKRQTSGRDIEIIINITLEDAFRGLKKDLEFDTYIVCDTCKGTQHEPDSKLITCKTCSGVGKIRRSQNTILGMISNVQICPECMGKGEVPEKKCRKCIGEGRVRSKRKITVDIPRGISSGDRIKVSEAGEAGLHGTSGDLYLRVHINPHKEFSRKGNDLFSSQKVSFIQATLGDTIKVNTIDGSVDLKIPKGIESGELIRLRGKGMPPVRGGRGGDYYIKINIQTPKRISRKAAKLFEELKKEGL